MKVCALCKSRYQKGRGVSFHKFPNDNKRLKLWLKMLGKPSWCPKKYDYICSKHFSVNSFIKHNSCTTLKKGSIPTISRSSAEKISSTPESTVLPTPPVSGTKMVTPAPSVPETIAVDVKSRLVMDQNNTKLSDRRRQSTSCDMDQSIASKKVLSLSEVHENIKHDHRYENTLRTFKITLQRVKTSLRKSRAHVKVLSQHVKRLKSDKNIPKAPGRIKIPPLEPRDIQAVPSASRQVDEGIPDTHDDDPELFDDDDVLIHDDVTSCTEDGAVVPARSRDIQDRRRQSTSCDIHQSIASKKVLSLSEVHDHIKHNHRDENTPKSFIIALQRAKISLRKSKTREKGLIQYVKRLKSGKNFRRISKAPRRIRIPPHEPRDIQAVPSASRQVDEGIPDTHDDDPELFDDDDVMIHDEVISDTEDGAMVPARSRDIQDEHCYNPKEHEGYSCNVCAGAIVGFRYVCVQCRDWDMCGTCEAAGSHAAHYVLRVPAPRAFAEMKSVLDAVRKALELSAHDPLYSGALLRPDAALDDDEIKSEHVTEEWDHLHLTSKTDTFVTCERISDAENIVISADEVHNESLNKSRNNHSDSTEIHDHHSDYVECLYGTLNEVEIGFEDSHTVMVKEGLVSEPATVRSVPAGACYTPRLYIDKDCTTVVTPIPEQLIPSTNPTEISRKDLTMNASAAKCIAGVKRKKLMNTANVQPRVALQRLDIPKGVFRIQVKRVSDKPKNS